MKFLKFKTSAISSFILLAGVAFTVFLIPLFPVGWQKLMYQVFFTIIYFAAVFNMEKYRNKILWFSIVAFLLNWISEFNHPESMPPLSKIINIAFFSFIVGSLVSQVAKAKTVTVKVILEAINGYLLVGIVFATTIAIIGQYDHTAFSFYGSESPSSPVGPSLSKHLYYTFITMTTVGYGDMLPVAPYARSLATLIAITGQFYLGIIVAMLVGKYASQRNDK